jgi:hypothetical protein
MFFSCNFYSKQHENLGLRLLMHFHCLLCLLNLLISSQKQFSELLLKAASDYGALTASVGDFQWSQNFRESPAVWGVS